MNSSPGPFEKPIFVTRPVLPSLDNLVDALQSNWEMKYVTNGGKKLFRAGYVTHLYELEEELRRHLKVPFLSVYNNGMTALMVAARHMFKQGEVITTPFTFAATPHALTWNNLTPVFCDIDDETLTLDVRKIESLITEKTVGILGVHVFGMPCNVSGIAAIASHFNLKVVYDAAHAFGTEIDGVGIGSYGDISMFSFHATKLFNTLEGGALACSSPDIEESLELYKDFGIAAEEEVLLPGLNGKMNEVQAAIGLLNLQLIDQEREKRRQIVDTYVKNLSGLPGVSIFTLPDHVRHSLQYFVIRISPAAALTRDQLYQSLKTYNIFTRKYFYPLCSNFDYYRHLPSAHQENLPIANRASQEVLCLPFYGDLQPHEVEKICEIIRQLMS